MTNGVFLLACATGLNKEMPTYRNGRNTPNKEEATPDWNSNGFNSEAARQDIWPSMDSQATKKARIIYSGILQLIKLVYNRSWCILHTLWPLDCNIALHYISRVTYMQNLLAICRAAGCPNSNSNSIKFQSTAIHVQYLVTN